MRQNFLLIQNTQRSCVTAISLPLSLVHDGTPHYPSLLAQSPGNPLHGATIGKFHRGLMAQFQQLATDTLDGAEPLGLGRSCYLLIFVAVEYPCRPLLMWPYCPVSELYCVAIPPVCLWICMFYFL